MIKQKLNMHQLARGFAYRARPVAFLTKQAAIELGLVEGHRLFLLV